MPAAVQRSTICPSRQRVRLRFVARAMEIIDSIGLELVNVFAGVPVMPRRATVNSSGRPSRREVAAPGCLRSNAVARALASRSPAAASGSFSARTSLASTQPRWSSGRCSATFRLLWTVQRWIAALATKTAVTAADRTLAPSMTTSSPSAASSPRPTRSARRCRATVLFSVAPSHSPDRHPSRRRR